MNLKNWRPVSIRYNFTSGAPDIIKVDFALVFMCDKREWWTVGAHLNDDRQNTNLSRAEVADTFSGKHPILKTSVDILMSNSRKA